MKLHELKKVQLNNSAYIGHLSEDGKSGNRTLTHAVEITGDFITDIRTWLKAENAGELRTFDGINGHNASITSKFSDSEKLQITTEVSRFAYAKVKAEPDMVNKYYENMR